MTMNRRLIRRSAPSPRRKARTRAAHRRLTEDVKAILGARALDRLTLDEIARSVHVSRFHLVRVFRNETGTTIADYRMQLRVRGGRPASGRLGRSGDGCSRLRLRQPHSHLTETFRRTLGARPSELRAAAR